MLGKKGLLSTEKIKAVLTDATETPAYRPKKKSAKEKKSVVPVSKGESISDRRCGGKKKRHTNKSQIIVNADSLEIICVAFSKGSCHDFNRTADAVV